MNADQTPKETFEEFKNSFSYGRRTDLNFKFLKHLPEAEAGKFIQELLWLLADTLDDGDPNRLFEHVYQGQRRGYAGPGAFSYADGPFTALTRPLAETDLALLTSSGHFVAGDDPSPFGQPDLTQREAVERILQFLATTPTLSIIPVDTPPGDLEVRHPGYDPRAVLADPNVAFPLEILKEAAESGRLGGLFPQAYSFVGACAQTPLIREVGPRWVEQFLGAGIEAMLLVPV